MRIMGIDYGTVRTGIAISDPTGTIAQPADYIKSSSLKDLAVIILNQCKEKGIKKIVLGLPLHMSGQESKGTEEVRKLGSLLKQDSNISIVFWEERLSTCAAERVLIEGNVSRAKRKKSIDSIAATIILQNYLESLNHGSSNMAVFVINIGNTNTQYGIYSDDKIRDIKYCPTTELDKSLIPDDMPAAVATVVPETKGIFSGKDVFYVAPYIKTGLDLSLIDTSTLGMDRLANAVALAKFTTLPAIAVDCGTAITVDAVDEKCVFRGGAIAPGRQLLRKALNIYTAQLPFVPDINEKPPALGRNTVDAIHSGVDRGILGLIKEIISGIQLEMGAKTCQLIAIGGDADFFSRNILDLYYGGEDFTLRGIAAAWELNQKCV